jgi:hypothetical protein
MLEVIKIYTDAGDTFEFEREPRSLAEPIELLKLDI